MRLLPCLAVLLVPLAASAAEESLKPFPLPSVDGKPVAVAPGQRSFRLPMGLAKVEAFYREQFKGEAKVTLKAGGEAGARTLTIVSKRLGDTWTKAVAKEGEVETTLEVTPVLRLSEEKVEGRALPLVMVIPRSAEAAKAADAIDHTERAPGR